MTEFAGWSMPLQYSGVLHECQAVRSSVGLFDISHLGRVRVSGKGAAARVATAFTVDAASLPPGSGAYALSLTQDGGIEDDLVVLRSGPQEFLALPNAANTAAAVERLRGALGVRGAGGAAVAAGAEAEVEDITADSAMLALQGPRAYELLSRLGADFPAAGPRYFHRSIQLAEVDVTCVRSGYTGEAGVELICAAADGQALWQALIEEGASLGIAPAGLVARDTLRLEMCYPLHGADIDVTTTPQVAGMEWAIKGAQDGCIGLVAVRSRATLIKDIDDDIYAERALVPVLLEEGIPRAGCRVSIDALPVGVVTSGGYSPTLKQGICLCRMKASAVRPGAEVEITIRRGTFRGVITKAPFVHPETTAK